MKSYYADRAPEYDQVYAKPERQADLRSIETWLAGAFSGERVLEVACGTGYWTRFICTSAAHVLALDAAPEMLRIARTRVQTEKVDFVLGDAYQLPKLDRSFGAAFAGFWISHVPKPRVREFLQGLHAALRPGARLVLLDNRYVDGSSSPISESDHEGNTYQERRLEDGAIHRVLKNFPSEEELRDVCAGLATEIRFKLWQYYWAMEYVALPP
jgi:ubiquinone/menaquinone biosynthesis C-methylase UbiE